MSGLYQEPHELIAVSDRITKHEELLIVTQCTVMAKIRREQFKEKRDFILLCDFISARPQGTESILERIVYVKSNRK